MQISCKASYGHLNIAGVQLALQALSVDLGGRDEKALLRLVQHLAMLALGDGSGGTPLPVPPQAAGSSLAKAVDRLGLEVLVAAWAPLGDERAPFTTKQAALRALAAVTRASLSSRPDDPTYVSGLYETLRGLLDKVDALRAGRRGLAAAISAAQAAGSKKSRLADIRQRAEMWGLLRGAFSAARLALPRSGLYKVAQRSLSGSLHLGILPSKPRGGLGDEGLEGSHLNLRDTWARVYLARGCAAAIQSGHIAGDVSGRGAVFWSALQLLALADPSERVALEAVRAMFGAPAPRATSAAALRQPGGGARPPGAASPAEQEAEAAQSKILGASWHLMCATALDTPPVPEPPVPEGAPPPRPEDGGLFARIARRLLRLLQSRSHSLVAGAARAVAVAAEARAWFHALSGGHGHEAEPEAVGRWMRSLQGLLLLLAGDDSVSGCEREAAIEALVWCQGLDQPPTLSPGLLLRAVAHGGYTAPPVVRFTFADPWPPCLLAELLALLGRRLRCGVGLPPEAVLELAAAAAAGAPAAVPREALAGLWDAAPGPLAVRSTLALLSAPLPPLTQPPASAAVEVKALAAEAEAAFNGLKAGRREAGGGTELDSALAASWLGEHVNSAAGEYAWKPWEAALGPGRRASTGVAPSDSGLQSAGPSAGLPGGPPAGPLPGARAGFAASVGGAGAGAGAAAGPGGATGAGGPLSGDDPCVRLAVAGVGHNPLLAAALAHLQRAILTGAPVVRVAAAQALAKIAVRSGEPYRIQAYSLLAAAAGRGLAAAGGSGSSGSGAGCLVCWCDPLGLAPVAGPALEVLDAMYAGELVLERHVSQYGPSVRGWPAPALAALRRRHEWLLGAIAGSVCAVPRELFLPLGPRSRRLLFPDEKEEAEEEARAAAVAQGPVAAQGEYDQQQYYDEYGQPYEYDYSNADQQYDYGDYYGSQQAGDAQADPYGQQQDPLARYDFSGQKAAAAVELNWGGEQAGAYDSSYDPASDASAVAEARPGVVLYSFTAETDEEVSVSAGDSVRVLHDLGEWLQVLAPSGRAGLVPAAYVQMSDEGGADRAAGAGVAGGGPGSVAGVSRQSSLAGSRMSMGAAGGQAGGAGGLQPAPSYAASTTSGAGGAPDYTYQYDNPEYDAGTGDGAYGSYYGDYGAQYGGDQYSGYGGGSAYGGGGGMYGDEGGGSAAGTGRGKKSGFGGFDDFGAVLAEAKTAAAVARQQAAEQQQRAALIEPSATPSDSSAAAAAASDGAAAVSYGDAATSAGSYADASAAAAAAAWDVSAAASAVPAADTADTVAAAGGGMGLALYEFVAEMEGELSVAAGEALELLGPEVDGWYSARAAGDPGRQGLIPASYVQLQ
ncbi:hypothetical protein GPECTOR_87g432 [Gonium pectorale]|uniref:SH3 domain-containing protein n=1 Tax=Gonium pectorale TaxID=33097 RepID=A0A150G139_GONPE|nr:hypothetical protein GPECTOR_87g432 [Gonium pectorale]|eukprot:KXZ43569.1 hypothetical protein GPECTOR_87g432 [Gonium pectorale]